MTTFEITCRVGLAASQAETISRLRQAGYKPESLGGGYWNITVEDKEADKLTDLLEDLELFHRMV